MIKANISQFKINKVFEFRYHHEYDDHCLKVSFDKYGQLRPIVVDKDFEIIDGYKLYKFMIESGVDECFYIQIDSKNYDEERLEFNIFRKQIDPIPFYKKLATLKLEEVNLPFTLHTLKGWVELLTWDWGIYKSKTKGDTLW